MLRRPRRCTQSAIQDIYLSIMLKRIGLAISVVILSIGQCFSANIELKTGSTPSASKVVERFIEAVGGRSAWLKITSQFVSGHVEILGVGHTSTYEVYTKPPNQSLVVMKRSSGGEMKLGFDGQRAWHQIGRYEAQYDAPEKQAARKRNSDFFKYLNFEKHFPRAKVTGIADVEGSPAYIVEAFPVGEKFPERLYFEVGSGLLVRSDTYTDETGGRAGPLQIVTYYLDYRAVDGIKLAFTLVMNQPEVTIISRHSRVENNLAIDDTTFRKPLSKADLLGVEPETLD